MVSHLTNRLRDIAIAAAASALLMIGLPMAVAATIPITSYDITEMPLSRFGCWSHLYDGTIALTGRTVIGCGLDPPVPVANYSGGSGTLNDAVIGTSFAENQLFTITPFDGGPPFNPTITLHLAAPAIVERIVIHGGDDPNNITPGAIDGITVEIGGVAVAFATTPFGILNASGVPVNDAITLEGSALAGMVTDRIVLRNFTVSYPFPWDELFSITEIVVEGEVAAPTFAGTPGRPNCHGRSVSTLARAHGGLAAAAAALDYRSVGELQEAIRAFCGGA